MENQQPRSRQRTRRLTDIFPSINTITDQIKTVLPDILNVLTSASNALVRLDNLLNEVDGTLSHANETLRSIDRIIDRAERIIAVGDTATAPLSATSSVVHKTVTALRAQFSVPSRCADPNDSRSA